jgi:hypothetical protein
MDWNDYPYVVWIIYQNIIHIKALDFVGFFNTNAFYPFTGTLLFSEVLLPETLIGLIPSMFTNNPVTVFNIILFVGFFLNSVASYFFWKVFFKSLRILLFLTLVTAFSPFIFLNLGHFQMLNIWPILFGLSAIFNKKQDRKKIFLSGVWLSVQFLSSVYICMFMLVLTGLWYFTDIIFSENKIFTLKNIVKRLSIILLIFFVLTGPFLINYVQVKNQYNIQREYWEYVQYSAHVTDYFYSHYGSTEAKITLFAKWNQFDKHVGESAGSTGFLLMFLAILGIFTFLKNKGLFLGMSLTREKAYFLIVMIVGFVFSLGPRLNVNGTYIGIPLPYDVVIKFIPIFEPIRVTARWSLLFYLGIIYFAAVGGEKIISKIGKETIVVFVLSIIYIFEIIPLYRPTEVKNYYPAEYDIVKKECVDKKSVLLEYPLTQDKKEANVITNLSYRSKIMLASVIHGCKIVNGYSGYIPVQYQLYEEQMYNSVNAEDKETFWKLVKERKIDLFKLNKEELYLKKEVLIDHWLRTSPEARVLFNNENTLIVKIH